MSIIHHGSLFQHSFLPKCPADDPTPYKPHYGVAFSRTGRKGPYACYYIHCEPGGSSFVGGGLWHPDTGHLAKLRAHIDGRPQRWRRVLSDDTFRETFLPGVKKGDVEGCVKAFAGKNTEGALKTKPKVSLDRMRLDKGFFFFFLSFLPKSANVSFDLGLRR